MSAGNIQISLEVEDMSELQTIVDELTLPEGAQVMMSVNATPVILYMTDGSLKPPT